MRPADVHCSSQQAGGGCHRPCPCVWTRPQQLLTFHRHQHARSSVVVSASIGPVEPPAPKRTRKPEWVRIMEEDADVDDDVARLLEGTDGDPDQIREKMRAELSRKELFLEGHGSDRPPRISFRQVDPFNLWIWFEFSQGPPSRREVDMFQAIIQAWFMVGKMGGYNSQNMQVFYKAGDDQSFFEYDNEEVEASQGSFLHDCSELETQGSWARCRVDLGTCDELALDALLNCVVGFSKDVVGISRVVVGGRNKNWPVPEDTRQRDAQFEIDPMQLPQGLDEEMELLDALEAEGVLKRKKVASGEQGQGDDDEAGAPSSLLAGLEVGVDDDDDDDDDDSLGAQAKKQWGESLMRKYSTDEFKKTFRNR